MGIGKIRFQFFLKKKSSVDMNCKAGFDYHFGSLENSNDELGKAFTNLTQVYFSFFEAPNFLKALVLQLQCVWIADRTRHLEAIYCSIYSEAHRPLYYCPILQS